jgi:hypothetical protein
VIGGGTSADIVFQPQTFPNAARPNNVVAPFWSDLNPAAAGAVRIGTLTDGVSTWIVVDWAGVRNFSNPTTHSFEIWLKTGAAPASEEVTMAYGTIGAGDPGSGVKSGAENRDGTSGANFTPSSNSDFTVNTSPPAAGGTGGDHLRRVEQETWDFQVGGQHDVQCDARNDSGRADPDGNAVAALGFR